MDLSRLETLFGTEKVEELKLKKIMIVGLGGVGGYAFESLVRCGIQKFILIDYDKITSSNINRQIIATNENIGKYKVEEAVKRAKTINKKIEIEEVIEKLKPQDIDSYKDKKIDFIIDACDDVEVKEELIRFSKKYNISLISSMGTGNKIYPEKLEIIELAKTAYDPIAKKLRKMVRDEKIKGKIMVVSSTEKKYVSSYKEIPSNSFVPATAGLLCASYVIRKLVGDN